MNYYIAAIAAVSIMYAITITNEFYTQRRIIKKLQNELVKYAKQNKYTG